MPGVLAVQAPAFADYSAYADCAALTEHLRGAETEGISLIVLTEDSDFLAATLNNFLWVTFTRANPSHDLHGVDSFVEHKHWGCRGPLVIDARIKPHHAPPLVADPEVSKRVDALFAQGGPLQQWG